MSETDKLELKIEIFDKQNYIEQSKWPQTEFAKQYDDHSKQLEHGVNIRTEILYTDII